jgi:hypothetical protein
MTDERKTGWVGLFFILHPSSFILPKRRRIDAS